VGKPECAVTPSLPEDFIRSLTTGNSRSLHGDLKAGRNRAATATWLTIVTAVFKFVIRVADPLLSRCECHRCKGQGGPMALNAKVVHSK
jgi:hypothetical protein